MDEINGENDNRLNALSHQRESKVSRGYTRFIKSMRIVLPLIAVGMTVVVLTWEDAGRRVEPVQKQEIVPQSDNIQNELLNPVFKSVDEKNQPFFVTAARATQNRSNPDILTLEKPSGELSMLDGSKIGADAKSGLYQQNAQKLNLEGDVHLTHSDGYILTTQELRIDLATQRAFSGLDVKVQGPAGTIDATGLEGDSVNGNLIFTGPAKVILYSDNLKLSPQESVQ